MRNSYKQEYMDLETAMKIYKVDGRINDTGYTGCDIHKTKVRFVCTKCGSPCEKTIEHFRKKHFALLCSNCLHKETCITIYGTDSYSKTPEFISKTKETCMKRYGVDNYAKTDECITKMKKTNNIRYGTDFYSQTRESKDRFRSTCLRKYGVVTNFMLESNKELSMLTCLRKYGVPHYTQTAEFKAKYEQTCLMKYGYRNYSQTQECKDRFRSTCLERYGVPTNLILESNKELSILTCLKKYGVSYYAQKFPTCRKSLIYNNIRFDSRPELDYYLEHIDNNIIREPISLPYEYNNEIHYYKPDFEVDDVLVEIKGKHFLNPNNNKWWNPYDHTQDGKYEAKYDCAIKNGVKIIYV